ncbi:MAG: AbrB/MazE/SpoVT family DNA-binding domain-containing protein [Phycisphaerae bacterium]|nr:AbrB/MazE/SpoVT family DNA-binding domain-containing protein [Phycisphaerae bacterium]
MKVTVKGQVTIPQHVRAKVGIVPGSEVDFVQASDGRVYLRPARGEGRGEALVARLRGRGRVRMTTEEIMALTRGGGKR